MNKVCRCSFVAWAKNDARAVQQTFANRDIRQYGNLAMFIHAENNVKTPTGIRDRRFECSDKDRYRFCKQLLRDQDPIAHDAANCRFTGSQFRCLQ